MTERIPQMQFTVESLAEKHHGELRGDRRLLLEGRHNVLDEELE